MHSEASKVTLGGKAHVGPRLRLRDAASAQLSGSGNPLSLHFMCVGVWHTVSFFTIITTTFDGVHRVGSNKEYFRRYPLLSPRLLQARFGLRSRK
jgi:hypothetical protein